MKPSVKKSSNQILFLVMLLITIIAIMIIMKSGKLSFKPSSLPEFEEQVKIIDNKYYNKLYHFGISPPSNDWEMFYFEDVDSLIALKPELSLIKNINVLAEMYRRDLFDTLSVVQVGIINLDQPRMAFSIAQQSLKETKLNFPAADSVRVVSDVTLTGASKLRGAYYVIEFPEKAQKKYPVLIAMFLVHNKLGYAIICRVRSKEYDLLRPDFEEILKSFRIFAI